MTNKISIDDSWLRTTLGTTRALLTGSLFILFGAGSAEAMPTKTIVVPKEAVELRVYKQRFDVKAPVMCRVAKDGPTLCRTSIGSEIAYRIQPEMILRYTRVRLDGREFAVETTVQGMIQFRTNKADYSGPQQFEVEIIYLR